MTFWLKADVLVDFVLFKLKIQKCFSLYWNWMKSISLEMFSEIFLWNHVKFRTHLSKSGLNIYHFHLNEHSCDHHHVVFRFIPRISKWRDLNAVLHTLLILFSEHYPSLSSHFHENTLKYVDVAWGNLKGLKGYVFYHGTLFQISIHLHPKYPGSFPQYICTDAYLESLLKTCCPFLSSQKTKTLEENTATLRSHGRLLQRNQKSQRVTWLFQASLHLHQNPNLVSLINSSRL